MKINFEIVNAHTALCSEWDRKFTPEEAHAVTVLISMLRSQYRIGAQHALKWRRFVKDNTMTITDYEKIATIVWCARNGHSSGHSSGRFGTYTKLDDGSAWDGRVEVASGPTVLVRCGASWQVQFNGFIGQDADLEEAARLALEAGRDVSATRDYSLQRG